HSHPASKDTHLVYGVETLGASGHFHHGKGLPLRRALGSKAERNPVDLRLHDARHRTVPFGADPHHTFCPIGEIAKLFHLWMIGFGTIRQRQTSWVKGADVATEPSKQPSGL